MVIERLGIKGINTGSAQTALASTWLRFIAVVILASIALTRLEERRQKIEERQDKAPLTPNINITLGAWITVI